jgi:hypothetical protein
MEQSQENAATQARITAITSEIIAVYRVYFALLREYRSAWAG